MMTARFYPVGIQTFEEIIARNGVYVDKTSFVYKMAHEGKTYFLSRPRRFGKSLLVSTLEAYFLGRKDLFTGLAIDNLETEWIEYPVFRFDMSMARYRDDGSFDQTLHFLMKRYEQNWGIEEPETNAAFSARLGNLIMTASEQIGKKAVVLVDEYDAPLLDTMTDKETFNKLRQKLRDFYSPLKACDAYLQFVFLTGITKFSQLSIFSELNNLQTITMSDDYAAICGITEEELYTQMAPDIEAMAERENCSMDEIKRRLKKKYDGYHFTENCPDIYNPFSLMYAFAQKKIGSFWFSSGTPTHLAETIHKYKINPEELEGFSAMLNMFDTPTETATSPIPVLYQSGYLTIKRYNSRRNSFILGYPNQEVRDGFCNALMPFYANPVVDHNMTFLDRLTLALDEHDPETAMQLMRSFFSSIPYAAEKQDENHYKTVFYLIFRLASNFGVRTEEVSAAGRCDALLENEDTIYLFEFKLDGTANEALKQIDDKGYAIAYEAGDKKIVKIGASFDSELRTIREWVIG